jgi:hypothetical protein
MLLFIIMNMSNYRVYFMRQSASAPGGKVSAPRSVPRAHCDPSARASVPIMYRPRHVICSPHLLPPVCVLWRSIRAQLRSVLAQSPSVRTYRNKSAPIRILLARTGRSPRPLLAVDACLGPV